ncbi:MAG: metallophosphoesterase family protein [Elusimicrobia bacterium]|nr:metallophosphoesterase family protein [Elusimicrobiota bacterium]
MRYGIISDIHGNYEALSEVLDFLSASGVEKIICCGDIVGYGPDPDECVDKIRSLGKNSSVSGNHDRAVAMGADELTLNSAAETALLWTVKNLSPDNLEYLSGLDLIGENEDFTFVHGSPRYPLNEYVLDIAQACANFKIIEKNICFIGHTHSPLYYYYSSEENMGADLFACGEPLVLDSTQKYLINVGSVGQPRDKNPDSSLCIYDSSTRQVMLHRVRYDYKKVQKKIIKAGLPEFLAYRLGKGI